MIPVISLVGRLDRKRLAAAREEAQAIVDFGQSELIFVLESEGGDFDAAVQFTKSIVALPTHRRLVKIYDAQSAAAFIALALRDEAEMRRGAELGFHRGSLVLEAPDVMLGVVPVFAQEVLREYLDFLDKILSPFISGNKKKLAEFHGSGWLRFSAEDCLRLGIVQRIF